MRIYDIYRYGVGIIFPPRCVVCDGLMEHPWKHVHEKCMTDLKIINSSHCMHCGRQLAISRAQYCPECYTKMERNLAREKKTFLQGKSLFQYVGPIKETMYRFKYANRREYGDYFADIASKKYGSWIKSVGIQVILPVPMYAKKRRSRGYNQAEVFAKALGRALNIPVDLHFLVRKLDTRPMKELNDRDRKKNLQSAFQTKRSIVQYSYVLVVDDIYTTGSTADALAEVLYDAGVDSVFFLSVCTGREI